MQTMQSILGPFFRELNVAIICDRATCNLDAERAKLQGARIAAFSELAAGEKAKTSEIQLLSGGDGITAKPMYKDPVTIMPRHLCILSTNHLPVLTEVVVATVERLVIVPFPVTFKDLAPGEAQTATVRQRDDGLKERLKNDQPAFLKWLVDGAVAWCAEPGIFHDARVESIFHDACADLRSSQVCVSRPETERAGQGEGLHAELPDGPGSAAALHRAEVRDRPAMRRG